MTLKMLRRALRQPFVVHGLRAMCSAPSGGEGIAKEATEATEGRERIQARQKVFHFQMERTQVRRHPPPIPPSQQLYRHICAPLPPPSFAGCGCGPELLPL